jgi:hypothetical protein
MRAPRSSVAFGNRSDLAGSALILILISELGRVWSQGLAKMTGLNRLVRRFGGEGAGIGFHVRHASRNCSQL